MRLASEHTALVVRAAVAYGPWTNVLNDLGRLVPTSVYESFFAGLRLERFENRVVFISTATLFTRRFLERNYFDFLCKTILGNFPDAVDVIIGHRIVKAQERHIPNICVRTPVLLPAAPVETVIPRTLETPPQADQVAPVAAPQLVPQLQKDTRPLRINAIIQVVAARYGVTPADVKSSCRTAHLVKPRQIAMYLAKILLPKKSFPEIGRRFGGRDHTTTFHAYKKIGCLAAGDPVLGGELDELILRIRAEFECPDATGEVMPVELPLRAAE